VIAGTVSSVHLIESGCSARTSSLRSRSRGPAANRTAPSGPSSCRNCGRNHPPKSCPAYKQTCKACGKEGHFAKVCRSLRFRPSSRSVRNSNHAPSSSTLSSTSAHLSSSVHVVQENLDAMFVGYLRNGSCEKSPQSCWWKRFNINNTQLRCKLDIGAEANVMSGTVFESLVQRADLQYVTYKVNKKERTLRSV